MGVYGGTDLLKIIGFKMGIIYDEREDAADEVEVREVIRERKHVFSIVDDIIFSRHGQAQAKCVYAQSDSPGNSTGTKSDIYNCPVQLCKSNDFFHVSTVS